VRAQLEMLSAVRKELGLPIVAIGGITHRNAAQVVTAGADAVAVISDLFDAPDIAERIEQFNSIFATHTALVADADAGV
jgi:thiamine-phosphate pyrophosphorylase